MSQRVDIHEQITNRIIEAIEKGVGTFKLPWHRPAGSITRPTNIQSKKAYRGINVVTLWVEAQLRGFGARLCGEPTSNSRKPVVRSARAKRHR